MGCVVCVCWCVCGCGGPFHLMGSVGSCRACEQPAILPLAHTTPPPSASLPIPPFHRRGTVNSGGVCQLLTILPLAYICTCTYYALFKINAFNYNKLLPR